MTASQALTRDELFSLLVAVEILDCLESHQRERLRYQEKREIPDPVARHGRHSVSQLALDCQLIYCRDSGLIEGPDADFLHQVFSSPTPPRATTTHR